MSFGRELKCHARNVFADTNSSHVEFWYLWYFNGGLTPLCVFSSCSSSNLFHPSQLWRLIDAIFIIIPFFPQQFVNIKRNKSQEQTCWSNLIVFWSSQSQFLALKHLFAGLFAGCLFYAWKNLSKSIFIHFCLHLAILFFVHCDCVISPFRLKTVQPKVRSFPLLNIAQTLLTSSCCNETGYSCCSLDT